MEILKVHIYCKAKKHGDFFHSSEKNSHAFRCAFSIVVFFHEKSMKMCVQLFKKGWSKNSMSFAGPAMSSRQPSLSISANMLPIYLRHLIVYLWHLRT